MRLYYPFEDNWHDASFPFADAAPQGSIGHTGSRSTAFSRAANFPNTSSNAGHYLRIPDGELGSTQNITITMWFRTNTNYTANVTMGMFGLANQYPLSVPNSYVPMIYMEGGGNVRARIWTTGGSGDGTMRTSNSLRDGNWHHVALVGNDSIQYLYIDGAKVDSLAGQIIGFTGGTKATIGASYVAGPWPAGGGVWALFNGRMDEFRVYGRALSDTEVTSLYNLTTPPTLPALTSVPSGKMLCTGTRDTLTVAATGNNLKYKWLNRWGSGGTQTTNHATTADSLFIGFANASFAGNYEVSVYDSLTGLGSRDTFSVGEGSLSISTQPVSGFYVVGQPIQMQAQITGTISSARWVKNGQVVSTYNANAGPTFTLLNRNFVASDTGYYYFEATNSACGTITSDTVYVVLKEYKSYYPFSGNFDNALGSWGTLDYNTSDVPGFTSDVLGNAQSAVDLNGTTQWFTIDEQMLNFGQNFTIAFWAKRDFNQNATFVDCQRDPSTGFAGGGIRIWGSTSGVITADVRGTTGSSFLLQNSNPNFIVVPGEWFHVALVKSGSTLRLYVDSVLAAQSPQQFGVPNKSFWTVGARFIRSNNRPAIDNQHNGALDELRFLDSAASLAQIQQWAAKPCQTPVAIASQTTGPVAVSQGGSTTLTVNISGTGSIRWFRIGQTTPLSNVSSLTISNFTAADTGQYYAQVVGGCLNDTIYSDTIQVNLSTPTGLGQMADEDGVSLFPNPATERVTVSFGGAQPEERVVRLMDASGRLISETRTMELQLDLELSEVAKGLYLVEVQHQGGRGVYRLVKR